jgi:positive phototaxis protein PixI
MNTAAPAQLQQFLTFQLPSGALAMLPASQLIEILQLTLSQVVPIADMPPTLMGVCNWRGEVLWLMDLGHLLGTEPLYHQNLRQGTLSLIIIQHRGKTLGLAVKRVDQMRWCNIQQIQPSPAPHITSKLTQWLRGYWSDPQEQVVLVLDSATLIEGLV